MKPLEPFPRNVICWQDNKLMSNLRLDINVQATTDKPGEPG